MSVVADDAPPLDELKLMLLDSLYGVDRGLNASSEVRESIDVGLVGPEGGGGSRTEHSPDATPPLL